MAEEETCRLDPREPYLASNPVDEREFGDDEDDEDNEEEVEDYEVDLDNLKEEEA